MEVVKYEPLIPDDRRLILNGDIEVLKISAFRCSAAAIESTAIIFAFGLDLVFARTAPSGVFDILNDNFSKLQQYTKFFTARPQTNKL